MHAYFSTIMEYRRDSLAKKYDEKRNYDKYREALKFSKFFYFLSSPCLVFQLEYPQTPKFRVKYFITKALQTIFHLVFLFNLDHKIKDFSICPLCSMGKTNTKRSRQ